MSVIPSRAVTREASRRWRASRLPPAFITSPPLVYRNSAYSAPPSTAVLTPASAFSAAVILSHISVTSPATISAGTGSSRPPQAIPEELTTVSVPLPVIRTPSKFSKQAYSSPPPLSTQSPVISRRSRPPSSACKLGRVQPSAFMLSASYASPFQTTCAAESVSSAPPPVKSLSTMSSSSKAVPLRCVKLPSGRRTP